jgi:uncharacterized membrane protein (UPF0127 family)
MCKEFSNPQIIRVRIRNKTLRIKDCRGLASLRGLMFDKMKNIDGALIYANNIWMPFVKNKLDLLFLDKNLTVIEIKKAVPLTLDPKTWKAYVNWKARYCLEVKSRFVGKNILMEKVKV